MTTTVVLTEYHSTTKSGPWNATAYTFTFSGTTVAPPESIDKTAKVEWRHRHSGTSALQRKWWRHRRTEVITMKGKILALANEASGTGGGRLALEALATRDSIWKITITCDGSQVLASPTLATNNDEGSTVHVTNNAIDGSTIDTSAFYLITDSSFSLAPGKKYVDWSLTFERVMN